ncbi:MAG: hypothetical protein HY922_16180 [Elusimicrobia bacterium]|nr:hypothetical protein [Elusimicrobiota bacterium]
MRSRIFSVVGIFAAVLLVSVIAKGKEETSQKTPVCRFVVPSNNAFEPYKCLSKCPKYTYPELSNWPEQGSSICMPCYVVATGGRKAPFKCAGKCSKNTAKYPVAMPEGGGYFACLKPDACFIVPTSNAFQPYKCVKQCPKGKHPEPTAWPEIDSYGCF